MCWDSRAKFISICETVNQKTNYLHPNYNCGTVLGYQLWAFLSYYKRETMERKKLVTIPKQFWNLARQTNISFQGLAIILCVPWLCHQSNPFFMRGSMGFSLLVWAVFFLPVEFGECDGFLSFHPLSVPFRRSWRRFCWYKISNTLWVSCAIHRIHSIRQGALQYIFLR